MACLESFLEDVVSVSVYKPSVFSDQLPPTVPNIRSMSDVSLPTPELLFAYGDDGYQAADRTISVKQTPTPENSVVTYTYRIEATVLSKLPGLDGFMYGDYHVVVTNADGAHLLLYALPGAFSVESSNNASETQITILLSSYNDYIVLT